MPDRSPYSLPESMITPESTFKNRRQFLRQLGFLGAAAMIGGCESHSTASAASGNATSGFNLPPRPSDKFYPAKRNPIYQVADRAETPLKIAGNYNNYYEFSTDKEAVNPLSAKLSIDPWTLEIGGLVSKPFKIGFEDLIAKFPLQERVYRMRCVEAWSMVVPWIGFPMRDLIDFCQPLSSARYVRFLSFLKPSEAPGQDTSQFSWPYFEGLRMDEARHDLSLFVTGIYGKPLPKQMGAPLRAVVPWKYGYKSAKGIVKIEFVEKQPPTFWNELAPDEYGFYSNVNPDRAHPRWSQATERDITNGDRIATLPYNGYAPLVASMYKGDEF